MPGQVDLQQHLASSVLRLTPIFSTWRPVVTRAVAAELVQSIFAPGDTIFFKAGTGALGGVGRTRV